MSVSYLFYKFAICYDATSVTNVSQLLSYFSTPKIIIFDYLNLTQSEKKIKRKYYCAFVFSKAQPRNLIKKLCKYIVKKKKKKKK